jgi:amino acid transporter
MLRPSPTQRDLVRAIGTARLTVGVVNVTVGAGVFVLPAVVAAGLGSASILAYLVCAATMALVVLCAAAAGSRVDATGGMPAYVAAAFGHWAGVVSSFVYWVSAVLAAASVGAALMDSVAIVWPQSATTSMRTVLLVILFALLAHANVRGVVAGVRVVQVLTIGKLLPLALIIIAGARFISLDPSQFVPLPSLEAIGSSSLVLIFAFLGLEVALAPSGEIRDTSRTVPRALLLALGVTTLLYVLVQAVAQGVLGASLATSSAAPLAEVAARLFGGVGGPLVLAGTVVSMLGYLSGDMLGSPRTLFALADLRILPGAVASIHPRYLTPWIAIVIHAAVVCTVTATNTFLALLVLASAATLLLYLMMTAASWELQRRHVTITPDANADTRPFVLPLGPVVPILAALAVLWLLAQTSP